MRDRRVKLVIAGLVLVFFLSYLITLKLEQNKLCSYFIFYINYLLFLPSSASKFSRAFPVPRATQETVS